MLPIHGYLSQGWTVPLSDINTPEEALQSHLGLLYTLDTAGPAVGTRGFPYAYSLDTHVVPDVLINIGDNHIKRIAVVRPKGNTVVYEFPWDPATGAFSTNGVPDGWDHLNSRRLSVLSVTDKDTLQPSQYSLSFPSGIVQLFDTNGVLSGVMDDSLSDPQASVKTVQLPAVAVGWSRFSSWLQGYTVADTSDSSRYNLTAEWSGGRIAEMDYRSKTSSDVIETHITYASQSDNTIVGLQKTDGAGIVIPGMSYSFSGSTITHGSISVTRNQPFQPKVANTVTLTTTVAGILGSQAEDFTFNTDGLLTQDHVTLIEPDGTTSQSSSQNIYQNESDYKSATGSSDGRYPANGQASWGKVVESIAPDGSWTGFRYDGSTGWASERITPFKSSEWNPSSAPSGDDSGNRVERYAYDANLVGGDPADPTRVVQPPRSVVDYVNGIKVGGKLMRYSSSAYQPLNPDGTLDGYDPFYYSRASIYIYSGIQPTVTSGALLPGTVSWGNTALWSTTQIVGEGSYTSRQGAAFVRSVRNDRETAEYASWGGKWLSEATSLLNPFGASTSIASMALGLAPEKDSVAQADQGPFGRVKKQTLNSSGLSTSAIYSLSGNFWWGPQSVTETDGSTTKYTYTGLGQVATKTVFATTQHSVMTTFSYDAAGNVVSVTTAAVDENGSAKNVPSVTNKFTYDAQERLTKEVDNAGGTDITKDRTTSYAYRVDTATGLNFVDITYPPTSSDPSMNPVNPQEEIATYLDGTTYYDTGKPGASANTTAVVPTFYDEDVIAVAGYDADGNADPNVTAGSTWSSVTTDGSQNVTTTYTNMLGQQYLVKKTGPGATASSTGAATSSEAVTYFDGNGRPYRHVDFDGTQTFTVYDPATGQPMASVTDVNRNWQYDAGIDRKTIVKPTALTTDPSVPAGASSSAVNAAGDDTTSQTVSNGGMTSSQTVNGLTTTDQLSAPTGMGAYTDTTTNPDGTKTVNTYADGLLSQLQHIGTDGATVLSTVSYAYDALRRLYTVTDSTGTTTYGYFQDGTPSSVQEPGHANAETVSALNLATNDAVKQTRSDLGTVTTAENGMGQVASQSGAGVLAAAFNIDPNTGAMQGFSLNALFNSTSPSTADSPSWTIDQRTGLPINDSVNSYLYRPDGSVARANIPGNPGAHSPIYNDAGDTVGESGLWSAPRLDGLDRAPIVVNTADGKASYTSVSYTKQQELNLVTFGSAGGTVVGYDYFDTTGYGATGSPQALKSVKITPPDEQAPVQTDYTYDPLSKRVQTITVNGVTFTYAYLPNSEQVQSVTAGGVKTTFTPDSSDGARIGDINVQNTADQTTLFDESVTAYNAQDQRTGESVTRIAFQPNGQQVSVNDNMVYGYDPAQADALTSVTDNGATVATYAYDGLGNRVGSPLGYSGDPMVVAAMNSGNAYDTSVQFDAGGRETNDGVFTYTYDSVNRLQSATPSNPISGSLQAKFGYDDQNRMLWEDVNVYDAGTHTWSLSYSRHFVWDGTNMLAMLDQNNVLLQGYTYGPTGLLAITSYPSDPANPDPNSGAITYMVVKDASGNVVELANPVTGTVEASYHSGAYGDSYSASGPARNVSSFAFAGGYRDPVTGLSYFLNRWYSPSQGRFITQDPTGVNGGVNYYEYAGNDPIDNYDPSGEDFIKAGENHFNPLYLGGANEQPVGFLEQPNHAAFHNYFEEQGLGWRGGNGDAARVAWQRMGQVERINAIINAANGADLTPQQMNILENNMPSILADENPGIKTSRIPSNMGPSMWLRSTVGTIAEVVSALPGDVESGGIGTTNIADSKGGLAKLDASIAPKTLSLEGANEVELTPMGVGGLFEKVAGVGNTVIGAGSVLHAVLDGLDVMKRGGPPQPAIIKQGVLMFHDSDGPYSVEQGGFVIRAWCMFNDETRNDEGAPYPRKRYDSGPLYLSINAERKKRGEGNGPVFIHLDMGSSEYKEIMKVHDQMWEDAVESAKWRETHPFQMYPIG